MGEGCQEEQVGKVLGKREVPDRDRKVPGSRVPDKDGGRECRWREHRKVPSRGEKTEFQVGMRCQGWMGAR